MAMNQPRGDMPSVHGHPVAIADSDERTIDAPILSETDRCQIATWNATDRAYLRDICVPQLVAQQASATPDAPAIIASDHVVTYCDLNRRANQLAHYLRTGGIGPDVPVGICLERSVDMVVGILGILKAGGAFLPMDPAYPPERLRFMLRDAQAPVLVTHQRLAATLSRHGVRVICVDTDAAAIAQQPENDPAATATAGDLAYVIYTSGSTGQPKGVQITHGSLLNLIRWHQEAFAVTSADRATQVAGPAFDATVWELWPYLTLGASVYVIDEDTRTTPAALRDALIARRITISFVPTPLAEELLTLAWPADVSLRFLLTGADTLHRYAPAHLPFALINNYGPTECTVVATSGRVPVSEGAAGPPSIGWPIANAQAYILDDSLQQVPIGTPGELYIGGAGLARGYVNHPELTAERFILHPFSDQYGDRLYRTGDLARYLPTGEIAFLGRVDDQIKIRGYRIEPEEIVNTLNAHPAVRASAVVARDDPGEEKRLVAYVVAEPGEDLSLGAFQQHLGARLPPYMIPAAVVLLDALPMTPNGKVARAALPVPDASNMLRDTPDAPLGSLVEQRVAEMVCALLHLDHVGLDDNFFLLGGHSMLGAQLLARIAEMFGVELSLRALFDGPTVREIAAEVERVLTEKLQAMSDAEVDNLLA